MRPPLLISDVRVARGSALGARCSGLIFIGTCRRQLEAAQDEIGNMVAHANYAVTAVIAAVVTAIVSAVFAPLGAALLTRGGPGLGLGGGGHGLGHGCRLDLARGCAFVVAPLAPAAARPPAA